MLISPVWNKTLKIWDTLFELINIKYKAAKINSNFFLLQEAGAFWNNIKEPQKTRPKLKNMYITYLLRIFALPAIQRKW